MTKISSFEKVIQQYDAIFFDAFGVLKNYNGLIEGVAETIYKLHNDQKQIFILTNDSSRSPFELAKRYQQQGIDLITEESKYDLIITTLHIEDMHVIKFAQLLRKIGCKRYHCLFRN